MKFRLTSYKAISLLSVILVASGPAFAQSPGTGAIDGRVTDSSGALLPTVNVTVTNDDTQASRDAVSSSRGDFRIALLLPGSYSVVATRTGFAPARLQSIHVNASETATVDIKLAVSEVRDVMKIDGTSNLAQLESATLGRTVNQGAIHELPLSNRNYTQIVSLLPNVVVELPNAAALGKNSQNVSASGNKTTSNNFQFNGIDSNNLAQNSASGYQSEVGTAIPAPDSIEEFKVQTGSVDAGYGRGAGANVDVISKSGSNDLHGGLFEYLRNDLLNANDFFAKRNGQARPVLKQNQFGGTLGGPILRDKLFFFAAYQGSTQRNGDSNLSLMTAILPEIGADRSAPTLGAQFCPGNHPGNSGYQTFAGGEQIACDGSNINSVALAFLNAKLPNGQYAIPSPQTELPAGSRQLPIGESTYSIPAKFKEDQYTANIDSILSDRNQLSGRSFYSRDATTEPFSPFGASVPGWGTNELDQNHMIVLSDTHAFGSQVVNVGRIGYMRFDGDAVIAQPIRASDVGMATPSGLPETPGLSIDGLFTIGTAGQPFYWQNTNTYVGQDTVSLVAGAQNLRFGIEAKRHWVDVNVPFVSDGFLELRSFPDFLLGKNAAENGSTISNVFAATGSSGQFRKDERYTDLAAFVQDDYKMTRWLTMDLGLRYEVFGPPSDIHGRLPTFDPLIALHEAPTSGTLSGFVFPHNYKGPVPEDAIRSSQNGLWATTYTDVSPRLGFAMQMMSRPVIVLRAGYGIYYDRMSGDLAEQTVGQPPFSFKQSLQGVQNAGATLQNPYSPSLPPSTSFPIFLPRLPGGGLSLAAISPHLVDPYVQEYNLNLQYEVTNDLLWEVGYVGSKSTHIPGCLEFNQAVLASPEHPVRGETTNTNENIVQRLPFSGIAPGSYICQTSFDARYNALETSATKRLSHGLQFLASYTWSKNLDTTSGSGGLSNFELGFLTNDQTNQRQARGLDDFDRAHRVVLSLLYTPPDLEGLPLVMRRLASNWLISTIAVAESGTPVTVIDPDAGSVYGNLAGFSRAQCSGLPVQTSGSLYTRINSYLNPNAFVSAPAIGDGTGFGNCGVGILRAPAQKKVDLALERSFSIRDLGAIRFRTEFFNLTNTPNFGGPISNRAAGAAFGLITSTATNPRIIQLALKYEF